MKANLKLHNYNVASFTNMPMTPGVSHMALQCQRKKARLA